ncbi:MAG: Stk1 family PASTA domain-containing Ser/Thr kinase [Clostridia bacterium]|nr:Stk1 family PASTA domain-containing Ser/Thr kinase [Clostridia bacterium]
MIGRVLGGRYEVRSRLGGGGMAVVYRAVDTFLSRTVAVKVLRHELLADEAFVERFRREARAAASLSDPRIVGVYDVGKDGDVDFIVMEFVDGETLKEKIRRDGPLAPRLAADIARSILMALEAAHGAGIVHRDVKPQNVIITRDGRVKVADFGIAQAADSHTLADDGRILGSAHYLAPEQAQGLSADERSDVYAVGVVLYEMLAGAPPFSGETALAVAMKHVREEPPDLALARPGLPGELVRIVRRALQKDPFRRYPTATAFREDLEAYLEDRPLPWAGRAQAGGDEDGDTLVLPPVRLAAADGEGGPADGRRAGARRGRRARRLLPWVALLALVLALAGGAVYGASRWLSVPEVEVPDVRGLSLDEAEAKLAALGLEAEVGEPVYSSTVPATDVAGQSPDPGTVVKTTRPVTLYLSKGPEYLPGGVPDVVGETAQDAEAALRNARLAYEEIHEYDDTAPAGTVIRTNPPAGDSIRVGDTVEVVVSDGPKPEPVAMPDLEGQPLSQAQALLDQLGLVVKDTKTQPTSWPANVVAGQDPPPGTQVSAGDEVTLVVSSGCGHEATVVVTAPSEAAGPTVAVEAVVTDSAGSHREFRGDLAPGSPVAIDACWVGDGARLDVYFDGALGHSEVLR